MPEQEKLFAVIRNIDPGDVYLTSFASRKALDQKLLENKESIELVAASEDYEAMLKELDKDAPPSHLERLADLSTAKNGQLNPQSLLWFLRKTKG